MMKKIMNHVGIGLAIGFVCTTACLWIFGAYEGSGLAVMRMVTAWLCASALYGFVSIIYHTRLSFPVNLMIHVVLCLAITFAASLFSGLFEFIEWYEWFVSVLPTFAIIYGAIGVVSMLLIKHQAKQINKKINNKTIEKK